MARTAQVVPIARGRRAGQASQAVRAGDVVRDALVERLVAAEDVPLVVVEAPAGYGKTTLLSHWADADARAFAWVDPHRRVGPDVAEAVAAATPRGPEPVVLVLDDAGLVAGDDVAGLVAGAIGCLPPGSQVVVCGRAAPALPLGRLAAERRLLRLGAADLAFDEMAAARLARRAGVSLTAAQVRRLVRRTEGWPAALTLALSEGDPAGVRGDGPAVAAYVGELLAPLPPQDAALLMRSAVLERVSPAMLDVVLGPDAARGLPAALRLAGLPVVSLDPGGVTWRHNTLVGEMLRAELARTDPTAAPVLHRRASRWSARAGDSDAAARHAHAAGDVDRAATLVWSAVPGRLGRGDVGAIERSLALFSDEEASERPPLALATAWCAVERGTGTAEDWIAAAEHPGARAPAPAAAVALLRAAAGGDGPERMRADAAMALRSAPEASPWRAIARLHEGVAHELAGDRAAAQTAWEDGAHRAAARMPAVAARCLARLALLTSEEDGPHAAARLALRARGLAARGGTSGTAPGAMVHAACALVLARAGRPDEARDDLARGTALIDRVPDAWPAVEARVVLARAAALLGDLAGARGLLREAAEAQPPGDVPEVLRGRIEAAREAALAGGGDGATRDALTTAELRVLGYLPTHLSFPAIAGRLNVSRFTVKTQAMAVYRKLGASSRAEAVDRAREIGLLA
ncbi:MAG TPA: LuxR C-terminal-related transcriptional regulator [Miltoncostaeaceae bacterium]|nr:LuxR C-terminal-related transcriptional regulator [Miltoncostaeaceae bacterium]